MAQQHGGYRRPEHPAAVSGPGALSQRTDGGPSDKKAMVRDLPNAGYGEGKDFHSVESGASMQQQSAAPSLIPLDAPSQNPGEPVTNGVDAGGGIGAAAAGLAPTLPHGDFQNMRELLPGLEAIASMPDSNPSTRAFVRALAAIGVGQ